MPSRLAEVRHHEALAEAQALEQTRLAVEGYRFYADESSEFVEASARAVAEAFLTT